MIRYETIEWTNTWVEEQGNGTKRRVLLIGDSIVNGARSFVKENLGEDILTDAFMTSHALDNPAFLRELGYMLEGNRYDRISFNNGLHGGHLALAEYERLYEDAVLFLLGRYRKDQLVLSLSTPVTVKGDPETLSEMNGKVVERNAAVERIAARHGLEVNDLYTPLLSLSSVRSDDGYHYREEGYRLLGKLYEKALR